MYGWRVDYVGSLHIDTVVIVRNIVVGCVRIAALRSLSVQGAERGRKRWINQVRNGKNCYAKCYKKYATCESPPAVRLALAREL